MNQHLLNTVSKTSWSYICRRW